MRERFKYDYPQPHELPPLEVMLAKKKIILANSLTEIAINLNQILHTELMNIDVEIMGWYQDDIISKEDKEKYEKALHEAFDEFRKRIESNICYPMYTHINK